MQSSRPPKSNCLHRNTSYDDDMQIVFLHRSPFYRTPKILCFIMFFHLARYPKSAPSIAGASTPCVIRVSWTHPTQHPKLHLDRFSRFAQLPSESPSTLQRGLQHD